MESGVSQLEDVTEANDGLELFKHTSLQEGQNRLAVISPGSFDDPIDIRLHIGPFSSSHPPRYAALSYVWGSPDPPVPITLNKKLYYVTPNLAAAIRRIRSPRDDRVYWIDALCIDQTNAPERSAQVRLMRQFYECAGQVMIYLGEESGNTDTAIRIIRTLAEIAYYSSDARDCPEFVAEFKIATLQMQIPRYDSPEWRAFSDFFARDWFGRVWVIQEAVVGWADPVAIVGTKGLTWSMIGVAADWFHGRGGYKGRVKIGEDRDDWSYHALLIQRCRWEMQQDDKVTSFLSALMNARTFRATDERDKVFSLVGLRNRLWERPGGAEFEIDYEKETAEVFRDVARHLIEDTMSLDILSNIEDHCGRKRKDLPSWAPDWTKPMGCAPFTNNPKSSNYKACGSSRVVLLEDDDPDVLAILGLCADEITQAAATFAADQREEVEGPPETYTVLRNQWDAIASKLEPHPSGGSALNAYWRTLIANVDRFRSPVPDEYFFHFAHYINALPGGPSGIDAAVKESLAARKFEKGDEVTKAVDDPLMKESDNADGTLFYTAVWVAAVGRRFFATKKGFMGIGPADLRKGDRVYVFSGANVPFVLRECADDSTITEPTNISEPKERLALEGADTEPCEKAMGWSCASLVGEAYVHGIMNGESIAVGEQATIDWRRIRLK